MAATDDPVARRYRAFFALLDWDVVSERAEDRHWPGWPPHPRRAYLKALLVKLCEQKAYITELRRFLVEHPALVLELGFRPVASSVDGSFDVERTVPCDRWLRHQQQHLDPEVLEALLAGTVAALQCEIPGLGTTVAVDVKHIYAWVQENNPKAYVRQRHDPARGPGLPPGGQAQHQPGARGRADHRAQGVRLGLRDRPGQRDCPPLR